MAPVAAIGEKVDELRGHFVKCSDPAIERPMPISAESKIVKYIEVENGMVISETWGRGVKNNRKMLVPEYNILL